MLGRTGVAHYGRRCSWAHSEGHIGVAHYGILVGGPLQLRWQPIGRRCLWAHLGEVPTISLLISFARETEMAGALVGGAFLSASLQVLFDRLASRDVVNFIRGHKLDYALLKKLKRKLLTVDAVLDDAEAKQITKPAVKEWMDELKVVVYDAEDVLDEIATEDLRRKIESGDSDTQTSMSMSTSDVQSINCRMEEIVDRLEDIVHDRDVLGLKEGVGEKSANRWSSTSLVDESQI